MNLTVAAVLISYAAAFSTAPMILASTTLHMEHELGLGVTEPLGVFDPLGWIYWFFPDSSCRTCPDFGLLCSC